MERLQDPMVLLIKCKCPTLKKIFVFMMRRDATNFSKSVDAITYELNISEM